MLPPVLAKVLMLPGLVIVGAPVTLAVAAPLSAWMEVASSEEHVEDFLGV